MLNQLIEKLIILTSHDRSDKNFGEREGKILGNYTLINEIYFEDNRLLRNNGVKAFLLCKGSYTSSNSVALFQTGCMILNFRYFAAC